MVEVVEPGRPLRVAGDEEADAAARRLLELPRGVDADRRSASPLPGLGTSWTSSARRAPELADQRRGGAVARLHAAAEHDTGQAVVLDLRAARRAHEAAAVTTRAGRLLAAPLERRASASVASAAPGRGDAGAVGHGPRQPLDPRETAAGQRPRAQLVVDEPLGLRLQRPPLGEHRPGHGRVEPASAQSRNRRAWRIARVLDTGPDVGRRLRGGPEALAAGPQLGAHLHPDVDAVEDRAAELAPVVGALDLACSRRPAAPARGSCRTGTGWRRARRGTGRGRWRTPRRGRWSPPPTPAAGASPR